MAKSPAERFLELPVKDREAFLESLSEAEAKALWYDWRDFRARPEQIAPDGDWDIWLAMAGRGFGKTRLGAEWVREQVYSGAQRIALVAETQKDLEEVMIEGDSGLLSVFPPNERPVYKKKPVQLTFHTGAVALGYNATQPDQLRGPQFDTAWCDETAKWRYARETFDQLQFGLRLGQHPKQLHTTTPRPIPLIKNIIAGSEGKVCVTRGRTMDNSANLAAPFLRKIKERYEGTRLGRQELNGEVLGDLPGALWSLGQIDLYRVQKAPENLSRIVVSVDVAVTNEEGSDEHGIIVAGLSEREAYVLEDGSLKGSPTDWARRTVALFNKYQADCIVVEKNQGGDMVAHTLRSVRSDLPIREVWASRGKHVRAEPIASLYEQGRVHHVGSFPELENQLTQFTNAGFEGEGSPDRADSLVWNLTELFPKLIKPEPKKKKVHRQAIGWMG
ncbi:DNA-packaging protein [Roseibium sp.]|uniref:DNA-packaging protein n=1 Tax=Roseibium sp. TaxID=1936156 RepID=UPI003B51E4F9